MSGIHRQEWISRRLEKSLWGEICTMAAQNHFCKGSKPVGFSPLQTYGSHLLSQHCLTPNASSLPGKACLIAQYHSSNFSPLSVELWLGNPVNAQIVMENQTSFEAFILAGLTNNHIIQFCLFVFFLVIYIVSFLSNFGMILLIRAVRHLQTPMYFFLGHLSFVDLCYSSTITPRMLSDFLAVEKSISFFACAIQMFLFAMFATSECLLVTAMAYDRYVAICRPLFYHNVMDKTMCWWLVTAVYISSGLASVSHAVTIFSFPLCGPNKINHFYCDIPPLLKLMCTNFSIRKSVVFSLSLVMGIISFFVILMSYVSIISSVLGIKSAEGRSKAFSTCGSHLTVVSLFYSTVFCIYFRPSMGLDLESIDKFFSIFYTVASPLLNPLIYSFTNKEVKRALINIFGRYSKVKIERF
ncbi:olfactory receptor 5G26-like [Pelodytes ibericus]